MPDDRRGDRWKLVLCYLPLLGFFPLLAGKSSREVRWHARNGLLLFGLVLVIAAAATLLSLLFQSLACLYSIGMFFLAILYGIFVVLAIVKALQGERLMFAGLSRHADR